MHSDPHYGRVNLLGIRVNVHVSVQRGTRVILAVRGTVPTHAAHCIYRVESCEPQDRSSRFKTGHRGSC